MNENNIRKIILLFFIISVHFTFSIYSQTDLNYENDFKFVFLTDVHIQTDRNAIEGFKKAIDEINKINPDFVITGGDLIYDALAVSYEGADSVFNI